jgi:hypothetical protein
LANTAVLPIKSQLPEGNTRWLFYDETYLPEPMPIRLRAALLDLSTAFATSKDMPSDPLTAHIGLMCRSPAWPHNINPEPRISFIKTIERPWGISKEEPASAYEAYVPATILTSEVYDAARFRDIQEV